MYICIKFQIELTEKYLQTRFWASKNKQNIQNKIDQNERMCETKAWNYWISSGDIGIIWSNTKKISVPFWKAFAKNFSNIYIYICIMHTWNSLYTCIHCSFSSDNLVLGLISAFFSYF